jgi:hypothetical protein
MLNSARLTIRHATASWSSPRRYRGWVLIHYLLDASAAIRGQQRLDRYHPDEGLAIEHGDVLDTFEAVPDDPVTDRAH